MVHYVFQAPPRKNTPTILEVSVTTRDPPTKLHQWGSMSFHLPGYLGNYWEDPKISWEISSLLVLLLYTCLFGSSFGSKRNSIFIMGFLGDEDGSNDQLYHQLKWMFHHFWSSVTTAALGKWNFCQACQLRSVHVVTPGQSGWKAGNLYCP